MKDVDKDTVVLMAARASRLENQDAIDCAIVSMLDDPKEVINLLHISHIKFHKYSFVKSLSLCQANCSYCLVST